MKKILIVALACLFHILLTAMEEKCQLVPIINGIEIPNGPVIDLCIAKQSQLLTDILDSVPAEQKIIPFRLPDCDEKTAQLFATYLTTAYEAIKKGGKPVMLQLESLSSEQKIRLCNVAEYALVPSLADSMYEEIAKDPLDQKLSSLINPDVRKKLASLFIAKHKCDATLLKVYSEKLQEKEHVLEKEGWLLKPFVEKRHICYFDNNTNTVVGVIKDSLYIKSLYITKLHPLQRWSTTLATIGKKLIGSYDEKIIDVPEESYLDRVVSFTMNNDETNFLCTCVNFVNTDKILFVDITKGTADIIDHKAAAIIKESFSSFLDPSMDNAFSVLLADNHRNYKLCNNVTKNEWEFKGKIFCENEVLLHNKQQIIRREKSDYEHDISKTTIIDYVDNVMRRFVKDISSHRLPLVVYTITNTPSGRIALNEQEYEEYENIPDVRRFMIDSVYVVTKENIFSRGNGVMRSIYRIVFPYIKSVTVWITGIAVTITIPIFLSILIPRISSKEFSDVLQNILKI